MYIAIEGVKGTGKTTLVSLLETYLRSEGIDYNVLAPTKKQNNSFMEKVNSSVPSLQKIDFWCELLYANRSKYAAQSINRMKPLILGDRSLITSYTIRMNKYPDLEKCVKHVDALESDIPMPDHIIYLDADVNTILFRLNSREVRTYGKKDETKERTIELIKNYKVIRESKILRLKNTTWHILDANNSKELVFQEAKQIMTGLLNEQILPSDYLKRIAS